MSTPGRRKNSSVIKRLEQQPYNYSFFQAVRLLERSAVLDSSELAKMASHPVARFSPPTMEAIRFNTNQALSFNSSEISSLHKSSDKSGKEHWNMNVNFMGLTGAMGVLPYHYTEQILQRLKLKDESLQKFLDLFNHRTISLFYQAAVKYNLPIEYERSKLNSDNTVIKKNDNHSHMLLSLIGLGTKNLDNRLFTRDESLIYYSGLLSKKVRTASGLKQIIKNHFGIPVEIKEFIGQWQELINDVRTRLPGKENPKGQNNRLGKSVMLGKKGWFAQGKIRIILGPLVKEQLETFSPGTKALKALNEIVRIYLGMEYDYDFIIRIKRKDIPEKITLNSKQSPIMGWNTWLSSDWSEKFSPEEDLDIKISASRLT